MSAVHLVLIPSRNCSHGLRRIGCYRRGVGFVERLWRWKLFCVLLGIFGRFCVGRCWS